MHDDRAAFSGIVGFRRQPWNILGTQARVATIRGATLRVVDADGREEVSTSLAGASAVLKRGIVRVEADGERFCLYGVAASNKVPDGLANRVEEARLRASVADGPVGAARESQAILRALTEAGVRAD